MLRYKVQIHFEKCPKNVHFFTFLFIIALISVQTVPKSKSFDLTDSLKDRDLLLAIFMIESNKFVLSFLLFSIIFFNFASPIPLFGTFMIRLKLNKSFGL